MALSPQATVPTSLPLQCKSEVWSPSKTYLQPSAPCVGSISPFFIRPGRHRIASEARNQPFGAVLRPYSSGPIVEREDLDSLIEEIAKKGKGVIMTMGKGGVGKTTVAATIALKLARSGHQVTLTTTDPAAHVEAAVRDRAAIPSGNAHRPLGGDQTLCGRGALRGREGA